MLETSSFIAAYKSNWIDPVKTVRGSVDDLKNCLGISYRWGPPAEHVRLEGYVNRIARLNCNIEALIRTVKRCNLPYFWLDSLCIDQSDEGLPSRLAEVAQMRNYYMNFKLVSVLGSYAVSMEGMMDVTDADLDDPRFEQVARELVENNYSTNGWHTRAWTSQESGVTTIIEWCGFRGVQGDFRFCCMRIAELAR